MALFGSDMVQVTTPDGRTLTVPSQLAAQFPGLKPLTLPVPVNAPSAPPGNVPVMLPAGGAPSWTPQDSTDLTSLTPPDPPPVPQAAGPAARPAAHGVAVTRKSIADPVHSMTNDVGPLTSSTLARLGNAGIYNAESAALDQKADAARALGQADAAEATHVGQMMAIRDAESQRQLEVDAKQANELQSQLQAKQREYEQNAKAVANTKIDRAADHPILAAIGVALGALGSALKKDGSENPALTAFYAAIDRKVAGQMQDLDRRRAGLADQRDALGVQRQSNMDRLAQAAQLRLGYLDQAQRQVETIKTMSQSDKAKANADLMVADIGQKKADELGGAMQREHAEIAAQQAQNQQLQMHRESLGVQYAGQAQAERHFGATLAEQVREHDLQRQDKLDELQLNYAKLGQKDKASRAGEVKKLGIWDSRNGDPLLDPEGQGKLKQVDRLEIAARQAKNPAIAAQQIAQAKAIREDAMVTNAVTAPDEKSASEIRSSVDAAQRLVDITRQMKTFIESDPSFTDREGWSALSAQYGILEGKYAKSMGERVSPRALDSIKSHILNFDPGNITSRLTGKSKALAALMELEKSAKGDVDGLLKSHGIKSGWLPRSVDESAVSLNLGDKTSTELAQDAEPGTAGGVIGGLAAATKVTSGAAQSSAENAALARAAPGPVAGTVQVSEAGLSPAATASIQSMARRADVVGNAERQNIVDAIAAPIRSGRESLANGILTILRGENPKLYREVLDQLPPLQAKELSQFDAIRSQFPGASLPPPRGPSN